MQMDLLFIDDKQHDLITFQAVFSTNEFALKNFNVKILNFVDYKPEIISKEKPDILLIDFRLDIPSGNDVIHNGFVLSTSIKDQHPDIPIILFSKKDIFHIQEYPKNILNIVDDIIFKHEIISENTQAFYRIYSLGEGCKSLRYHPHKNWEELLNLLNAPPTSHEDLIVADKPNIFENNWKVPEISSWIRNVVIKFPGILYYDLYAATYLGISVKAFDEIKEYIKEAQYTGIFRSYNIYYWKSILRDVALKLMTSCDIYLPVNVGFRLAWNKIYGQELEPSRCIYSGEEGADRVCYILNEQVKTKYSFAYNVDNRPAIMDEARVSWKAIRTTNEVNEDLLGPIAREMLPQIKSK